MSRESIVNSLGENTEMVVKEKDYDEYYSGEDAELNACTNLRRSISNIPSYQAVSLQSCESLL